MNRKYIGLGIIFLLIVSIFLCIFLIPSASDDAAQVALNDGSGVATTFGPPPTTPRPLLVPTCSPGSKTLELSNVRVKASDLYTALTGPCSGIESLELLGIQIEGSSDSDGVEGAFEPLQKMSLPKLQRFTVDRILFSDSYTMTSKKKKYLQNMSEEVFQNDFLFLKTRHGGHWSLRNLSSELDLKRIEIKINGLEIFRLDEENGTVRFRKLKKPLENDILFSIRKDPSFVLRNLTGELSNLNVDDILAKKESLAGLYLYYSSLFSTFDPSRNLHNFIPQCSALTELHLHLFEPPFTTLDTVDLVPLTKLKKFSFQYGGSGSTSSSDARLTHNSSQVVLRSVTYVYIATEWGTIDKKFTSAIPTLFPNLETIIFDSYNSAYHGQVLHQLLKMPSLLSITFYSYNLFPEKDPQEDGLPLEEAEGLKTFLRYAGITPGLHDFIITRPNFKERWQGRELRYFEKEGYSRLAED